MTFRFIEEHREPVARAPAVRDARRSPPPATTPGATARPAPGSSGATPSSWRSGPSTPRSRPATAARASTPSWWPAASDCCVNTVAKLMRGQRHRRPRRRASSAARPTPTTTCPWPTTSWTGSSTPTSANESWVADITYIPTREGWLYLAAVEDLYSRRVVGWSMARSHGEPAGGRCPGAGGAAAPAGRRAAGPLRPRQPVRQRALPTPPGQPRDHVQHEPPGATAGTTPRWRAFSPP